MAKVQIESPIHIVTSGNTPTTETLPLGHIAFKNEVGGSRIYIHGEKGIEESIVFKNLSFLYDVSSITYNLANVLVHYRTRSISSGAFSLLKMQIDAATKTTAGVMSAADKAKLDSLSATSGGSSDGKMQISLRKERIYDQSQLQEWYENIELFEKQGWVRPLIPESAASWKFYIDGIDDFDTYCLALFTEKNTIQRYRYFNGTSVQSKHRRRRGIKLCRYGDADYIDSVLAWNQGYQITGLTAALNNRWIDLPFLIFSAFNKNDKPRKIEKKYYLCVLDKNILYRGRNYKMIVNEFGNEKPAPITLEDAVSNIIEITIRYSTSVGDDGQTVWTGNVIF